MVPSDFFVLGAGLFERPRLRDRDRVRAERRVAIGVRATGIVSVCNTNVNPGANHSTTGRSRSSFPPLSSPKKQEILHKTFSDPLDAPNKN
jgi:hypothetical protein